MKVEREEEQQIEGEGYKNIKEADKIHVECN